MWIFKLVSIVDIQKNLPEHYCSPRVTTGRQVYEVQVLAQLGACKPSHCLPSVHRVPLYPNLYLFHDWEMVTAA